MCQEAKLGVRAFGLVGFTVGACSATSCQLGPARCGGWHAQLVKLFRVPLGGLRHVCHIHAAIQLCACTSPFEVLRPSLRPQPTGEALSCCIWEPKHHAGRHTDHATSSRCSCKLFLHMTNDLRFS